MKNNPFRGYFVSRDNYLSDPDIALALSEKQEYKRRGNYPGLRTENLLLSTDEETRNYAINFIERIKFDVFPGLIRYECSLHFHVYEENENDELNYGITHSDSNELAGVLYLTKDENDFESGTSICNLNEGVILKESEQERQSRFTFNFTGEADQHYENFIRRNKTEFTESIRVANKYNRLIGYDALMFHKPNYYKTKSGLPRKSLLFFIYNFEYDHKTFPTQ